jgi:hypothetical protein
VVNSGREVGLAEVRQAEDEDHEDDVRLPGKKITINAKSSLWMFKVTRVTCKNWSNFCFQTNKLSYFYRSYGKCSFLDTHFNHKDIRVN